MSRPNCAYQLLIYRTLILSICPLFTFFFLYFTNLLIFRLFCSSFFFLFCSLLTLTEFFCRFWRFLKASRIFCLSYYSLHFFIISSSAFATFFLVCFFSITLLVSPLLAHPFPVSSTRGYGCSITS